MDVRKLQRLVVDALEDVKAHDIKVFNTVELSDMFERVVVASGTSNRQTRALASSVVEKVKEAGGDIVSVEGMGGQLFEVEHAPHLAARLLALGRRVRARVAVRADAVSAFFRSDFST